jgi:membrane protease subunit HflK
MEIKEKTALITLTMNVLLTVFKFGLFLLSGSLAVLAEAWHSFSDIATSFMVYFAIRQGNRKPGGEEAEIPVVKKSKINLEQVVALCIGLFLLVVAVLLIGKFLTGRAEPVNQPLLSGGIFLVFALGSYLVYRFESSVGLQEKSVGLISDGMHARTDMIASLVTGFSLILYYMGLDIDKWVAGIIALFVLSFAIETIVNVSLSIMSRESEKLFRYKIYNILGQVLSPSAFAAAGRFLDSTLHIKFFSRSMVRKAPVVILDIAVVLTLCYWVSTCKFTVGPSEQAIVERFGEPVNPEEPLGPGLHFKAPWPMDRAVMVETEAIRRMNIGNITDPNTFALIWRQRHGTEIPFISGDNNYFYPYLVLHYRIKNLYDFLYRHENPEQFLEDLSHELVYKLFAVKPFFEIACTYRTDLVKDLYGRLQAVLDDAATRVGIEIVNISIKDIHPPIMIADSYELVIAEIQEKERTINEALGYRNQNLPETRGESAKMRKEAEAYAIELPLWAEGDAKMFLSRIPENDVIRQITQRRLWLSAMETALKGRSKVVVDPLAGQPEIWLNMNEMFKKPTFEFEKAQF